MKHITIKHITMKPIGGKHVGMKQIGWRIGLTLALSLLVIPESVPRSRGQSSAPSPLSYHDHVPDGLLPPTVDPQTVQTNPAAFVAYTLASRIPSILYQVPCYCGCERVRGHSSLLDCFTGDHGIRCHMCQREAIFCYIQHQAGRSASQIRDQLARGQASHLDLDTYTQRLYAEIQSRE